MHVYEQEDDHYKPHERAVHKKWKVLFYIYIYN